MAGEVRIIKKYPNRRLYDTKTSNYITLAEVKVLVIDNVVFRVIDAKRNEDITRSILLQIILDEEGSSGMPIFSSELLAQLIRYYGQALQGVMGSYLEKSIGGFIDLQKKLQEQARTLYGEAPKLNSDLWAQFLKTQGSAMPGLMGSYLEQSANMYLEIQEQMRKQALNLFAGFPYQTPAHESVADEPADRENGADSDPAASDLSGSAKTE